MWVRVERRKEKRTESKERKCQKKERKDKITKEWKTRRKKIGIDFFKTKEKSWYKTNYCM